MKNVISLLFLFLIFSFAWSQDNEKKTLTMSPFQGLKIYSNLEIRLIASDVNKAIVNGKNSDFVVVSLKNNILKIRISGGSLLTPGKTKIDLYHSRPLDHISVHQGSLRTSASPIKQTSISLIAKTNAIIDLEFYGERIDTKATLGGRVYLKGNVNNHEIVLATSGLCEADELITNQTKVKSKTGAYAYLFANSLIDAQLYGGTIRVFGNPVKRVTQELLGAKVYLEK